MVETAWQAGTRISAVSGDDDQSIYGWRGAEVGNILRFEKDFPGAKVIRLEQNYRSTPHILAAASGVIAANKDRLGKTLFTNKSDEGEKVRLIGHWDGEEEARWIGEEVEAYHAIGHPRLCAEIGLEDHGNSGPRLVIQMRAFEDRFLTIGLPYRVIGGPRFYERMEIRDAMAYFRVGGLALMTIWRSNGSSIRAETRGIGDKAQQKIQQRCAQTTASVHDWKVPGSFCCRAKGLTGKGAGRACAASG